MATSNTAYYGARDPLGAEGDFTTAPEISQMFGEMIGLWCADLWLRAGQPGVDYVELGPGRGTLALDALRAMARCGLKPNAHFVETSPALRAIQATRVSDVAFHDSVGTLPTDRPLAIVANEFFDALPVHQVVKSADGWHQRLVACQDTLFLPIAGKRVPDEIIPEGLREAGLGSIIETAPLSVTIADQISTRLKAQGGALLIIDYGYEGPALGETLQAVRRHAFANPFAAVGQQDLTAHVDFATLAAAGKRAGLRVSALIDQGRWLEALGMRQRAEALVSASPERAAELRAGVDRLTAPDQMGQLFKVLAMTAPDWPEPTGI